MRTQQRVLNEIERQLDIRGYEMVNDPEWANTGTLGAISHDDVRAGVAVPSVRLRYDFQTDRASFRSVGSSGPAEARMDLSDPVGTTQAINIVVTFLIAKKPS